MEIGREEFPLCPEPAAALAPRPFSLDPPRVLAIRSSDAAISCRFSPNLPFPTVHSSRVLSRVQLSPFSALTTLLHFLAFLVHRRGNGFLLSIFQSATVKSVELHRLEVKEDYTCCERNPFKVDQGREYPG